MSDYEVRRVRARPKSVAECISRVTEPVYRKHGHVYARLIADWPQIVGPVLANCSVPQKISFPTGKNIGGTLTIEASSGWATELQFLESVILEKIAVYFGYRAIEHIGIRQSYRPSTLPAKTPMPALKPTAVPVACDPERLTADIADESLRSALNSLAKTLHEG